MLLTIQYLLRSLLEHLYYTLSTLRTGLKKHIKAILLHQLNPLFVGHLSFVSEIIFLTHKNEDDLINKAVLGFIVPCYHIIKALSISYRVDYENTLRAEVKGLDQRLKLLLAGRVPNLKLNFLIFHLNVFALKLYSDGHLVPVAELISGKFSHKSGLSDP